MTPPSTALGPLLLLGIITAVVILAIALRRRRRAAISDLATCGHCGYAVTGLTTFICPECGSDLREVGIIRGRGAAPSRPRGKLASFFRVVGWKLMLFAAVFSIAAVFCIDYYQENLRPTTWIDTQIINARPESGAYSDVTFILTEQVTSRGMARRRDPQVARREVSVDIQVGPDRFLFVRDVIAGTNTYHDAAGMLQTNAHPVSKELRVWMSDHGVNITPAAGAEIDVIASAITQSSREGQFWDLLANQSAGQFQRDSAYLSGGPQGVQAYYTIATSIAIAVGLGGLMAIWLRNRRRLALEWAGAATAAPLGAAASLANITSASPKSPTTLRTLSVMFSDVKDYTARSAGESRLGVLDLVRRHRDLAQPIIKQRGGRIVKSLGDGLLITFESATDAVLAGLAIQDAAASHNQGATVERDKIELRIAVSTGEVVIEGEDGDILGDAVNLASRAQQHAAPGEVLFTEAACATINRREVQFAEAGTFEIKGIVDPVRLYRATPTGIPKRS